MAASPNKFSDPYWTRLADQVEAKLALPAGLLNRIVNLGERSNNDQVSEAGARSPFQIIPATRAAAIKKYGIDPYLSDENAAEVAGNLLKDSLARNGGNEVEAVGEYHGGVDRSNWGPRTRAYIGRVTGGGRSPQAQQPEAEDSAPVSTYDRIKAKQQTAVPVSQIGKVFEAYQAGSMDPDDAKQFERDVKEGKILLPDGEPLQRLPPAAQAAGGGGGGGGAVLPAPVAKAYADGTMGEEDRIQLEQDVRAGVVSLPAGVPLGNTQRPGLVDKVKEAFTGDKRRTAATESTPDWADMPELNSFSMAGAKTGLGTMISNPKESVEIIQSNFPGVRARQDDKGNYFLKSSIDGKEYAIKPGFRPSDIPRAGAVLAAYTPAGRATTLTGAALASGATQAVIEGTQSASGGTFNPEEVAIATALGPVVPAVVRGVKAGVEPVREIYRNARGIPPPGGAPPVATMTAEELAQTTRTAATGGLGSKGATAEVAAQTFADPKIMAAAKRLGIEDHLQPDHVTTNQAYRELAQAVKSVPGSETRAAEMSGLEAVAKRADDLVDELGGTRDLSLVDATMKSRMSATQKELSDQADLAYSNLRANIPARAEAPAPTVLSFIDKRLQDLGGAKKDLSTMERNIMNKLAPKDIKDASGNVIGQQHPTYALLDDVRRDLTAARVKRQGPFKDADTGMIKKLERELMHDQKAAANAHGQLPQFQAAQGLVRVRKGLEDDMVALFGKELNKSMVGDLNQSLAALPKGDTSKLMNLLKAIPETMRKDTMASGLSNAFNISAKNQQLSFKNYTQWYEGLVKNKQSYTMLMANLPPEARKRMSDLYRVSKGISDATRERITTGRIMAVSEQLRGADTLMGNLFDLARRSSVGAVAEVGTTAAGMPGTGLAAGIASALTKGKPNAMKAADALISSPEFLAAARSGSPAAIRRLGLSKAFADYRRALKNPRELSNPEKWIQRSLLGTNQHTDKQQPKKKD